MAVEMTKEQRERLEQAKVVDAYKRLFGPDAKTRSEVQRIVWEDLKKVGYARRPVFVADKSGALCPMRAAFADGRRSVMLYIAENVKASSGE